MGWPGLAFHMSWLHLRPFRRRRDLKWRCLPRRDFLPGHVAGFHSRVISLRVSDGLQLAIPSAPEWKTIAAHQPPSACIGILTRLGVEHNARALAGGASRVRHKRRALKRPRLSPAGIAPDPSRSGTPDQPWPQAWPGFRRADHLADKIVSLPVRRWAAEEGCVAL